MQSFLKHVFWLFFLSNDIKKKMDLFETLRHIYTGLTRMKLNKKNKKEKKKKFSELRGGGG